MERRFPAHNRRLRALATHTVFGQRLSPVASPSTLPQAAPRLVSGRGAHHAYPRRITSPSAWVGSELLQDEESWRICLGSAELAELRVAQSVIVRQALRPPSAVLDSLSLGPACQALGERIRAGLNTGRGFWLVHGFPVEGANVL